ncbi:hypothetical protein [Limisphaera sp. VF-2]|uniref:hypothetical protein n=1 Tax=Limisphaera sp. VF-2 TaxID=3400418 RepID=UPI003C27CC8E
MRIESLHIGMRVRHPQYGTGIVRSLNRATAEIEFSDGTRAVSPELAGLEPAEPQATLTGLDLPLRQLVAEVATATLQAMGVSGPGETRFLLARRWHGGRMVLHPADPTLQTKEVPLDVFFHKIVLMRNQLRVLEQKINSHERLTDAEKVELQEYITRCYGSMTTFNLLFANKEDQF